jgi:pyroglutamyl-peptidase
MRALLTGFGPYGGRGVNPAYEVVRALDGRSAGEVALIGRTLPVSYQQLRSRIPELLDEFQPNIVISLGLWPGEATIRLERFAANLADFEIPDNDGALADDAIISDGSPTALAVTLPVRQIEQQLLAKGIPARLSSTAGTFLCNATLFAFLATAQRKYPRMLCGFIHLPYLPLQVARLMIDNRRERRLELHQRADLASMDLPTMIEAVGMAVEVTGTSLSQGQ